MVLNLYTNLFIFIFGLLIGSFINVVTYRLPREESVVNPPSHCPSCGKRLTWWQLVPVISYSFLMGKCFYCKKNISFRYPLTELIFGLIYLYLFSKFGLTLEFVSSVFLFTILFAVSIIDLEHRIIPDKLNLVGAVGGVLISILDRPGIFDSTLGFIIGGGLMLALAYFSRGGMGGGDIKLTAVLGLFLGWQGVLLAVFIASGIGSIVGILLNLNKGKKIGKAAIPFGPFLSIGALTVYLYGNQIIQLYLDYYVR